MAEYWVGPSIRRRPVERWTRGGPPVPRVGSARRAPRRLSARRARAFVRLADAKLHDVTFLARYGAHLVVLALTVAIAALSGVDLRLASNPISAPTSATAADQVVWQRSAAHPTALDWRAAPLTYIAERPALPRTDSIRYTVAEGDTPTMIAQRFGLQPATIIWANPELEKNPDLLSLGQELTIPAVDGVWYTVKAGDTVEKLAETFKVDAAAIVGYAPNRLVPGQGLVVGQQIMVPNGQKPFVAPAPLPVQQPTRSQARARVDPSTFTGASGTFRWPLAGRITQQPWKAHMALDIAAPLGTPVIASDAGVVVYAGWDNTGYGYTVVIDHGNGFRTRYAHFSWYYPDYGAKVQAGEVIGKVGSTGHSSGPHLHFEILKWGARQNPYNYLP